MTSPKIPLADMPAWPRFLCEYEAAAYVRLSVNTFRDGVGTIWPNAVRVGRRKLYDRLALDRSVDELSKGQTGAPAVDKEGDFALG